ncbi:MAG: ribonuclease HI, partial [Cyanobacteria bacterium J06650_10]
MPTDQVKEIYTDGACSGNPGPGGWGTRIEFADGQVHELGGRDAATTNNRMEMQAAIAALDFLNKTDIQKDSNAPVTLHTDSEYVKNGITKWIKGWKRKGWKTSAGKPVLNKDLWQQLDELSQALNSDQLTVEWRYVRGHTGNPGNERCDEIARAYSHSQPISLNQFNSNQASKNQADTAGKKRKKSTKEKAKSADATEKKVEAIQSGSKNTENQETPPKKPRDNSIDTPDINTGTTPEPSQKAALRFYETSPSSEQAIENEMAASSSSKNSTISEVSRIDRIQNTLKTLQVTDELAQQGYLITSAELADLMDVNASAVTSRGDYWAWRNWTVSRIRREGN